MDYSLLIGIHNLDQAAREEQVSLALTVISNNSTPKLMSIFFQEKSSNTSLTEDDRQLGKERITRMHNRLMTKQRLVAHSTAMESIQAQTDPIDEEDNLP